MIWRGFLLIWCLFILSQGPICFYTAWQMWKVRKTHPVGRRLGMVKTALCLTTGLATYSFFSLLFLGGPRLIKGEIVYLKGLDLFNDLPLIAYINLTAQALLSAALWSVGLYFADFGGRYKRWKARRRG